MPLSETAEHLLLTTIIYDHAFVIGIIFTTIQVFKKTTLFNVRVSNCINHRTLESSRFGIDGQRDTHMLPKTNLIQYLAAYQQQLLARSGIILPPVMLPNSSPVPPLISSSRSKGYEIPPTFPKPVEVISDRQK
ncbi:hypothetical protein L5515_018737 [Caenorhabditis briggsae]|uniref:Uncharacterized protein n=1 Tax=Caenorhabditis briggsae TaxID=6238 RepID=A0AAE9FGJ5_CAEBR|nr:hypothetical protein L5515_018737 [Caenorhabditis briggsae]